MERLIVGCERPELVIIKNRQCKPCQCNCCTPDEYFRRDHLFLLHLNIKNDQTGESHYLGSLTCQYVRTDSARDVSLGRAAGLDKILDYVLESGYAVDNLAIIKDAVFIKDSSYDDLDLAFSRLHCILCQAMSKEFGPLASAQDVGMYFDFSEMNDDAVHLCKRFIGEYKDGDMRKEETNGGLAWFIHKIPWPPEDLSEKESSASTEEE